METNGIMVWTGCSSHRILLKRTELWFGQGCSSHRILVETNGIKVWTGCSSHRILLKRTELWFGHGCSSHRILLEHERNYGLGMDALVTVFSWNTSGIMVWAWMLQSPYSLGTRTELWFGLDALVTVFSWKPTELWFGLDALVTVFS